MRQLGIVFLAVIVAAAAIAAVQMPDIQRYLKMRSM